MSNSRNRTKRARRRRRRRINYKPVIAAAVLVLLVIAVIFLVKSCGHDVGDLDLKSNQSALYLKEDGSVVYGAAEDFGSQEFDEAALETQIEQEVKQFNEKNASVPDSMELEDFDVSDNVAKVIFSFETSRDFAEYMRQYNRENDFVKEDNDGKKSYGFYLGDAEEYDGDRSIALEKPDKSGQKALEDVDGTLLLLTGNYQVQIEGTVDYVSGGCSVDGNTVSTPKDSQGYIIYH